MKISVFVFLSKFDLGTYSLLAFDGNKFTSDGSLCNVTFCLKVVIVVSSRIQKFNDAIFIVYGLFQFTYYSFAVQQLDLCYVQSTNQRPLRLESLLHEMYSLFSRIPPLFTDSSICSRSSELTIFLYFFPIMISINTSFFNFDNSIIY